MTTYIFVGGSGIVGLPIARYFYAQGYKVCIVDIMDPNEFGLDIPFHRANLLEDSADTILPRDMMVTDNVVVLNFAMVPATKNGVPKDISVWSSESKALNPILARNVVDACCLYTASIKAVYYISTLSIYNIARHIEQGIPMPEKSEEGFLSHSGYGIGKRLGEEEMESAIQKGLVSTGVIRLSTPKKECEVNHNWVRSGTAYVLTDDDCSRGVECILTQQMHPCGCTFYNLDSIADSRLSNVDTTNALRAGFRPSIL